MRGTGAVYDRDGSAIAMGESRGREGETISNGWVCVGIRGVLWKGFGVPGGRRYI